MKIIGSALVLIGILSGCGGTPVPTGPKEYRAAAQNSMMGEKETFTLNRSYYQVASILQKNSRKCLNKSFKVTNTTYGGKFPTTSTDYITYSSKFKRGGSFSTLDVRMNSQSLQDSGMTAAIYGKPPKDGYIIAAADIRNLGGGKTQVDLYHASILMGSQKKVVNAIKAWMNGTSRSCPNLAD